MQLSNGLLKENSGAMFKCRSISSRACSGETSQYFLKSPNFSLINVPVLNRPYVRQLRSMLLKLWSVLLTGILSRALRKLLSHVKVRTYSKTKEELWLGEWRNPLAEEVAVVEPETFLERLQLSGGVPEKFVLFCLSSAVLSDSICQWILL